MSKLSKSSISKVQTLDKRLQDIVLVLASSEDIQVIEGKRTFERQKEFFNSGATRTMDSKHVTGNKPSRAVDIAPLINGKIEWKNTPAFHALAKKFLEIAKSKNINVRWGGDWNQNGRTDDEKFRDLVHFELMD